MGNGGAIVNHLMLCLCMSLRTGPEVPADRFFAEDKLKHFAVSFVFTSLATSGARATGLSRRASLLAGASAGMGLGVAKEIRDLRTPESTTASVYDLAWDAMGVGTATILAAQTR
jgi:uncharacterized protein YfiM (DUF2279 family)